VAVHSVRRLTLPSSGPAYGGPLKSNVRRRKTRPMHSIRVSLFAKAVSGSFAALVCACTPNSDPTPVFENGKIVEILNCSPPSDASRLRCLALICEKELHARGLLPPGAKVVRWTQSYNRSDNPTHTTHTAKYSDESTFRYAACEMTDLRIESTNEVIPRDQDK